MSYGFVYMLGNPAMPHYYKIGCTERAPHKRASELSSSTAVPQPFQLLCYIEVPDFQLNERRMHQWLSDFRVTAGREFFHLEPDNLAWALGMFRRHPFAVAYTQIDAYLFANPDAPQLNPWDGRLDDPGTPPKAPSFGFNFARECVI